MRGWDKWWWWETISWWESWEWRGWRETLVGISDGADEEQRWWWVTGLTRNSGGDESQGWWGTAVVMGVRAEEEQRWWRGTGLTTRDRGWPGMPLVAGVDGSIVLFKPRSFRLYTLVVSQVNLLSVHWNSSCDMSWTAISNTVRSLTFVQKKSPDLSLCFLTKRFQKSPNLVKKLATLAL